MNTIEEKKRPTDTLFSKKEDWIEKYLTIREYTNRICEGLETEDCSIQPCFEVSPPKWHLAHTSWFFEEFILARFSANYRRYDEHYNFLFNSYYKSAGKHWLQGERGYLSRPTVTEILDYRKYVDEHLIKFIQKFDPSAELDFLLEVGLHHEQQHQELLFMDIKYILGLNVIKPAFTIKPLPKTTSVPTDWKYVKEGLYTIGHDGTGFAFDNEGPQHKAYLYPHRIQRNYVTNGDYLEFINDKAYATPNLWLSKGWDWVQGENIQAPLYWFKKEGSWYEYTLHGVYPLDLNAPVCHVSYFEADAFATWAGSLLPTEQALEVFLKSYSEERPSSENQVLHPNQTDAFAHQVWCWTRSHYSSYPGYKAFQGVLGEYSGKFMCNQFILKGGCVVTPSGHYRHTYRNFYQPHQRWMFSGIRLTKELS